MPIIDGVGTNITAPLTASTPTTTYVIEDGETLSTSEPFAINFDEDSVGSRLIVDGEVEATGRRSVAVINGAAGVSIQVAETGSISGGRAAVVSQAAGSSLTNHGEVSSSGIYTVVMGSPSARVTNTGEINNWAQRGYGVSHQGDGTGESQHAIFNSGVIRGLFGIGVGEIGLTEITNTGRIRSHDGGVAVYISSSTDTVRVDNTGKINGGAFGVVADTSGLVQFHNAEGALLRTRGDVLALDGNVPTGFAYNGGSGMDQVTNAGRIDGNVHLSDGNDSFLNQNKGVVNGQVFGGEGNDTIYGGKSADRLKGGNDNDVIRGRNGDDQVYGSDGDDTLYGGRNNDRLQGGTGNDQLKGGKDSDIFVFRTGWDLDRIVDFDTSGADRDRIDLSGLSSVQNWADLRANHLQQFGNDVVIDGGNGDRLVIEDTTIADLSRDDFIF